MGVSARSDTCSSLRSCEWVGCKAQGDYRAPRSRSENDGYWWFCIDHVRLYNASWNYYAGMSDEEIEADIRKDTVWQRPSWPLGAKISGLRFSADAIKDPFGCLHGKRSTPHPVPKTPEEQALSVLQLSPPVTVATVKARYKVLVKQYHPDVNGGDKDAEERFKVISEAYRVVMQSLGG